MAKKQLLKLLAVMLVLVLCVASFAACSQSSDDQEGKPEPAEDPKDDGKEPAEKPQDPDKNLLYVICHRQQQELHRLKFLRS